MNAIIIAALTGLAAWLWSLRNTQAGSQLATSGTVGAPGKGPAFILLPAPSPAAQAAAAQDPANVYPFYSGGEPAAVGLPGSLSPTMAISTAPSQNGAPMRYQAAVQSPSGPSKGGCGGCGKCDGTPTGSYPDGSGACMYPDQKSLLDWLSKNFPDWDTKQADAMKTMIGSSRNGPSGYNQLPALKAPTEYNFNGTGLLAGTPQDIYQQYLDESLGATEGLAWNAAAQPPIMVPGPTPGSPDIVDPRQLTLATIAAGGASSLDAINAAAMAAGVFT